jgi:DNA repair and recombination RAD54-like protein
VPHCTAPLLHFILQIYKWCGDRVKPLALADSTRDKAILDIGTFLNSRTYPVLIISYETFRIHVDRFKGRADACDLLICDEAHRLKNEATLTNQALASLPCRRRILLSGTPMQNDLEEFYAMVDFTNPGILGDPAAFR